MDFLVIFLGIILCTLFFLNIKNAANILCRIVGGFLFLILYSSVSPMLSLPAVGVNIVTASLCGILEIPGALLLIVFNTLF